MTTPPTIVRRRLSGISLFGASLIVALAFMFAGGLSASAQSDSTVATGTETTLAPDSAVATDSPPADTAPTDTATTDTATVTSDTSAVPVVGVAAGFGGTASDGSDTGRNVAIGLTAAILVGSAGLIRNRSRRIVS